MKTKPSIIFSSLIFLSFAISIGLTQYDGIGKFQQLPSIFSSHIIFTYNNPPTRITKYRIAFNGLHFKPMFEREKQIHQKQYSIINISSKIVVAYNVQKKVDLVNDSFADIHRIVQPLPSSDDESLI